MPKPTPAELAAGIIAIGAEPSTIEDVGNLTIHRLAELGLAQWCNGQWELTAAGAKLLPKVQDGAALPELE